MINLKKTLMALLSLLLSFAMFACGAGDGGENGGGQEGGGSGDHEGGEGNGATSDDGYLYKSGTTVKIISPKDTAYNVSTIFKTLLARTGKAPIIADSETESEKHEVVLGETARLATSRAKRYVDMQSIDDGLCAWCIYAQGDSVAIYWTDENDILIDEAIEYFVENCLAAEEFELKDGVIHMEIVDFAARIKEEENKIREKELQAIADKLGDDARDAMREYLTLFDEDFYLWLAGLYDAKTGALYYSNSGRDNVGFLPDLESTSRGYGWLTSVGMLDKYNGDLKSALPDWLVEKLIKWTQGLQSSKDGFFYHPQWGTNITVSRRGRDLSSATSFLIRLGGDILYDTPDGHRGTLGAPTGALVSPLGGSSASAVSKVVSASLPDHLASTEAFRAYIESFDWSKGKTYSSGSTLQAQTSQIKGAGAEIVGVYEEVMNAKLEAIQEELRDKAEAELKAKKPTATAEEITAARKNAENGLWETEINYESVNGLMKIGRTYHDLGLKLPYAEAAYRSAMCMVTLEGKDSDGASATEIVKVFNPWVILDTVQANIRKYGTASEVDSLRKLLTENAAELIRVTRRKVAKFEKPDGSFGYNTVGGQAYSQSAHVATGVDEGDVNGATIATTNILAHMCNALGIAKPHMYFDSDFEKFIEAIENATPIDKPDLPTQNDGYERFDSYTDGPVNITSSGTAMNTGSLEILEDARGSGKVLKYVTKAGANSSLGFASTATGEKFDTYVFEWEMNITEAKASSTAVQIMMGSLYMLTIRTESDGFTLGDSSSTNGSVSVTNSFDGKYSYGKWYKIRIEYVMKDGKPTTSIYVDGNLVGTSNNFNGNLRDGGGTPSTTYNNTRFFALMSAEFTVLFDNVLCEKPKT